MTINKSDIEITIKNVIKHNANVSYLVVPVWLVWAYVKMQLYQTIITIRKANCS